VKQLAVLSGFTVVVLGAFSGQQDPGPLHAPIELASVPLALNQPPPELEVPIDGSVWWNGERLTADASATPELLQRLAQFSMRMMKSPRSEILMLDDALPPPDPIFPAETLWLRVDRNAPFETVAMVLTACRRKGIEIWDFEFPIVEEEPVAGTPDGSVDYEVPQEILAQRWGVKSVSWPGQHELQLSVAVTGRKLEASDLTREWSGTAGTRFEFDSAQRKLHYHFDGFETDDRQAAVRHTWKLGSAGDELLRIIAGPGVTFGEVLAFWNAASSPMSCHFESE